MPKNSKYKNVFILTLDPMKIFKKWGVVSHGNYPRFLAIGFNDEVHGRFVCNRVENRKKVYEYLFRGITERYPKVIQNHFNVIPLDEWRSSPYYVKDEQLPCIHYIPDKDEIEILSYAINHDVQFGNSDYLTLIQSKPVWVDIGETLSDISEWVRYKKEVNPKLVSMIMDDLMFGMNVQGELIHPMESSLSFSDMITSILNSKKDSCAFIIAYHNPRQSTIFEIEKILEEKSIFPRVSIVIVKEHVYVLEIDGYELSMTERSYLSLNNERRGGKNDI